MTIGGLSVVADVPGAFTERVVDAFGARAEETFSIALSGGETARRCYERLAQDSATTIDWWKVDVYWGDERCVPHDHPDSNYYLAREALLDRVGAAHATHLMRCAEGPDPYQLRLGDLGGLDLVHLGMGPDGHTAGLFPGCDALDADPGRLPHPRRPGGVAGRPRGRRRAPHPLTPGRSRGDGHLSPAPSWPT